MFTQEISDTGGLLVFSTAISLGGVVLVVIGLLLMLGLLKWGRRALLVVGITTPILVLSGAILITAGWFAHNMQTLHISVDDGVLAVGFHSNSTDNEQIPLQNIAQCKATSYDWRDYGIGGHHGQDWRMYNVEGDGGIATDLTVNNEPYKHLLFSSPDPKAVCDALRQQRPDIKEA